MRKKINGNKYSKPELVTHGTLKELTQKIGSNQDGISSNYKS
ncbi:lasso RiPP family leader peptide-containing protein [Methanobacterium oryzae]